MQLSLQNFPTEIRYPVVMSLKTWADYALVESLLESFKVVHKAGLMIFPVGT